MQGAPGSKIPDQIETQISWAVLEMFCGGGGDKQGLTKNLGGGYILAPFSSFRSALLNSRPGGEGEQIDKFLVPCAHFHSLVEGVIIKLVNGGLKLP